MNGNKDFRCDYVGQGQKIWRLLLESNNTLKDGNLFCLPIVQLRQDVLEAKEAGALN